MINYASSTAGAVPSESMGPPDVPGVKVHYPRKAVCSKCGTVSQICCDSGTFARPDGQIMSLRPFCTQCCYSTPLSGD